MIKSFDDPEFLLEEFYRYNEEVGGRAKEEDARKDEFNDLCREYKEIYEKTRHNVLDKLEFIGKNINKVILLHITNYYQRGGPD